MTNDIYILVQITAHGTIFESVTSDPQTTRDGNLPHVAVGPATVGADGYSSEEEAADALRLTDEYESARVEVFERHLVHLASMESGVLADYIHDGVDVADIMRQSDNHAIRALQLCRDAMREAAEAR